MASVVTAACVGCKYTDCVVVCPVECFYQDDAQLYINPDDCICCQACIPECPVQAIYDEADVPPRWASYVELNRSKTRELIPLGTAHITAKQPPAERAGCRKI